MARTFTDGGAAASGLATSAGHGKMFDDSAGVGAWAGWLYRTGAPAAERGLWGFGDFATDVGWWVTLGTTGLAIANMPFATANRVRASVTAMALNAWTHLVVNSAGKGTASTDFSFIINGKPEAGTSTSNGAGAAPIAGTFAAKLGPGPGTSAGANSLAPPVNMGLVGFWNRQLSEAEGLSLYCGAHPLRYRVGLLDWWDMDSQLYEEGEFARVNMLHSTTVPASTFMNPAIEAYPLAPLQLRQNVKARQLVRGRFAPPAAAAGVTTRRTLHPFGNHVGGRLMRVS
jgi:hypothetical protein